MLEREAARQAEDRLTLGREKGENRKPPDGRTANVILTVGHGGSSARLALSLLKMPGLFCSQSDGNETSGLLCDIGQYGAATPVNRPFQRRFCQRHNDFGRKTGFYADSTRALITFVPRAWPLIRGLVRDQPGSGSARHHGGRYLKAYESVSAEGAKPGNAHSLVRGRGRATT